MLKWMDSQSCHYTAIVDHDSRKIREVFRGSFKLRCRIRRFLCVMTLNYLLEDHIVNKLFYNNHDVARLFVDLICTS